MSRGVEFGPTVRGLLDDPARRDSVRYGYLTETVHLYLDGLCDRDQLAAVLDALEAVTGGGEPA
jgi:hypothetical protein